MRASRIFALARTIRWATVGGLVRKARAISSVVKPHTSRSVIATWASGGKAGWQQVKISRSRSSSTLPSSHCSASLVLDSSCFASSVNDASKRARRRMPSMALKRPVDTSHARGLAGTPSRDHCSTATAKASCSASSAASKSPSRRISVARTWRDSERYTASTSSRARSVSSLLMCLELPSAEASWPGRLMKRRTQNGVRHILSEENEPDPQWLSTGNALQGFSGPSPRVGVPIVLHHLAQPLLSLFRLQLAQRQGRLGPHEGVLVHGGRQQGPDGPRVAQDAQAVGRPRPVQLLRIRLEDAQ